MNFEKIAHRLGDSDETFLITDRTMNVGFRSESAAKCKALSNFSDFTSLLCAEEAFRAECFCAGKSFDPTYLTVSLCNAKPFEWAVITKIPFFSEHICKISFFCTKKELITSIRSKYDTEECKNLSDAYGDILLRDSLIDRLVYNVSTLPHDRTILDMEKAIEYICQNDSHEISPAEVTFSSFGNSFYHSDISTDKFVFLFVSALRVCTSLSSDLRVSCELRGCDEYLAVTLSCHSDNVRSFPVGISSVTDFVQLSPSCKNAMFLCEMLSSVLPECSLEAHADPKTGTVMIRYTFSPAAEYPEFKSRDMLREIDEYLKLCTQIL